MELTASLKALFIDTATTLKGSERRRFIARTVEELGPGGQRHAERELGWNRQTIRKALRELHSGLICLDALTLRRRKRAEEHLPNLLTDILAIVDSQSQADPQFRSSRLYTRLTAAQLRRQLIAQKGYKLMFRLRGASQLASGCPLGYLPGEQTQWRYPDGLYQIGPVSA
jgi:hypothetical protein